MNDHKVVVEGTPPSEPYFWTAVCKTCGRTSVPTRSVPQAREDAKHLHESREGVAA